MGVDPLVDTVSVVCPEVVTDVGLNDPVAPAGRPITLKLTVPVNPPLGVTVAVYVVLAPRYTVRETGLAEIVKFDEVTVIVRVAGLLAAPPLSVTVNDAV